jgi:hypothetical protein
MRLQFGTYQPPAEDGTVNASALTNAQVVQEAADFLQYAVASGRRATPHH